MCQGIYDSPQKNVCFSAQDGNRHSNDCSEFNTAQSLRSSALILGAQYDDIDSHCVVKETEGDNFLLTKSHDSGVYDDSFVKVTSSNTQGASDVVEWNARQDQPELNIVNIPSQDHIADLADFSVQEESVPSTVTGPIPWFERPYIHYKAPSELATTYEKVVHQKCSNRGGARYPVKTNLNVAAWEKYSTGHEADQVVLDGIRYGFSLQYRGGPIYNGADSVKNHHSARAFPKAVQEYITREINDGALIGPFREIPFRPWCKISPLMSRPKNDSTERRIIVDLSFPDGGINAHIAKNNFDGEEVEHKLPTVQSAVDTIRQVGVERAVLATIDISRAYRNFQTCPADWPLLVVCHDDLYYIDRALPFGSRMSSWYMTNIALFICRALSERGVQSLMYLDDLLLIAPDHLAAERSYQLATSLFSELGLPIAVNKLVPPTRDLVWLGIRFDLENNTLAIPGKKLEEIRETIISTIGKQTVTVKQLQRVIGMINHLAKAVPPARLFMSRLLQSLRGANGRPIKVDEHMKADMHWFEVYLRGFNGRAIITDTHPHKIIEADACPTGMGAHDGHQAYSMPVTAKMSSTHSISRLECLNCLLAARTFINENDRGHTVIIRCDNESSIFTYMYGRARDAVMSACARAMWMLQATYDINIVFVHVPGSDMIVADSLSRVFNGELYTQKAEAFIKGMGLTKVRPKSCDLDYSAFL